MRARLPVAIVLAAYVGLLLVVVLAPTSDVPTAVARELITVARSVGAPEMFLIFHRVEFALNVAMVVPVAVLGSATWPRLTWRDWLAIGFVTAGAVEVAQGALLPERVASFSDVVANTTGAAVGAVLVAVPRALHRARRSRPGVVG